MAKESVTALTNNLAKFTGTTKYFRINFNTLLTDGAYYLVKYAGAYWLMTLFSDFLTRLHCHNYIMVLDLIVNSKKGHVNISDGNGNLIISKVIRYTDFPLTNISLFGCWDGNNWVIMLTSEY